MKEKGLRGIKENRDDREKIGVKEIKEKGLREMREVHEHNICSFPIQVHNHTTCSFPIQVHNHEPVASPYRFTNIPPVASPYSFPYKFTNIPPIASPYRFINIPPVASPYRLITIPHDGQSAQHPLAKPSLRPVTATSMAAPLAQLRQPPGNTELARITEIASISNTTTPLIANPTVFPQGWVGSTKVQQGFDKGSTRVRQKLKQFQKLGYQFGDLGFRFVKWGLISIVVIGVVGPFSAAISSGQDIAVVIHHGGKLVNDGKLRYEGRETSRFMFDPDVWSYFVIVDVVKSLGYQGFKDMWYSIGGASVLDDKLESLCDDNAAMHMVNLARLNGEVHVFVIHLVSEPEVIHMLEFVRNDGQVEERGDVEMGEEVEVEEVRSVNVEEVEEVGGVLEEMGDVDGQVEVEEVGGDGEHEGEEENEVEIRSWSSSFENASGDGNTKQMEELVDVNVGCDIDDEIQANFEGNVEVEVQSMSNESTGARDSVSSDSMFDVNVEGENDRCLSDDEWESEQLVSGLESNEEDTDVEGYGTFATFVLPKSMIDFKWEVGTYFAEKQDILEAMKSYSLDNGRNIKFLKNDKQRMRLKCVGATGKCPWRLYFGYMKAVKTWQLRRMLDSHTCSREFNLKLIDSKWLSKKIEKTIRDNPTVKGVDIREKVQRKYNIGISRCMAYRAKNMAREQIDGSFKEQYKRLYDYAHELLAKNPGSTVKLQVEDVGGEVVFKRFYVCLKACKDSFMSCRPIIGLDGAFLKGKYGGELLTAMLPIAYCVVEVENKDSWRWFLELLVDDLGGPEICSSFTFMSDQQKGLLHAIDELLPKVDQRFCVRHMYSNFKKKYPGKNLKRLMWRAATATHPQSWEMEMRNIRALNEDAYKHLIVIPPRYWSRSRFIERAKCDTLVNNMSEGFNNVLLSTRSKSIITLLEEIRLYLMQRWAKNRTWMMTRIPYCHSLAAMKFLNIDGEKFIDTCYLKVHI
ncbi:hypothetical protein V8G54_024454 [Vigna mungo]|uniref:Transposase MuDR plant domain-containing protein n=1 Tax=Vigna mungo TaxID=3915 RepID=A0AAQ3RSK6_VIGMU